jgi:hypothetical protein
VSHIGFGKVEMTIQLTPQQFPALDVPGEAARVVDPRDNTAYVLVSEADYETVREILEDERRQRVIHEIGVRNAIARMDESP